MPKGIKFAEVVLAPGRYSESGMSFGIEKSSRRLRCWGHVPKGFFARQSKIVMMQGWNRGTARKQSLQWIRSKALFCELPASTKWHTLAQGYWSACGIVQQSRRMYCWGAKKKSSPLKEWVPLQPTLGAKRWASVSGFYQHLCAIEETSGRMHCWGNDAKKQVSGWKTQPSACPKKKCNYDTQAKGVSCISQVCLGLDAKTRWAMVSVGWRHTCAIEQTSRRMRCWGDNELSGTRNIFFVGTTVNGWEYGGKKPENMKWATVSSGYRASCAIEQTTQRLHCWGYNHNQELTAWMKRSAQIAKWRSVCHGEYPLRVAWQWVRAAGGIPTAASFCSRRKPYAGQRSSNNLGYTASTRWTAVVARGDKYFCGTVEGSHKPICWGKPNSPKAPTKVQWDPEKSCLVQHPQLSGPASCTMCPKAKGCHHTITDPKRNAGTCTTTVPDVQAPVVLRQAPQALRVQHEEHGGCLRAAQR